MSEINWPPVSSYADALSQLQNGAEGIWVETDSEGNEKSFSTFTKALARNQTCTKVA